jgi:hypothetical protein
LFSVSDFGIANSVSEVADVNASLPNVPIWLLTPFLPPDPFSPPRIRPVWHQKEERVLAHILVCFLSFVLWRTLGEECKRAGLGDEPRRVLSELSEIRLVDVVLPTDTGQEIRTRCVTRPSEHQKILLDRLGLKLPSRIKFFEM